MSLTLKRAGNTTPTRGPTADNEIPCSPSSCAHAAVFSSGFGSVSSGTGGSAYAGSRSMRRMAVRIERHAAAGVSPSPTNRFVQTAGSCHGSVALAQSGDGR
jgi:hypothetical protein